MKLTKEEALALLRDRRPASVQNVEPRLVHVAQADCGGGSSDTGSGDTGGDYGGDFGGDTGDSGSYDVSTDQSTYKVTSTIYYGSEVLPNP